MKKLIALSCLLFIFTCAFTQQSVTLQDVANGTYRPQNIYGIKPMLDGEHYTQISSDRKRIVKYSFKTGEEAGTIITEPLELENKDAIGILHVAINQILPPELLHVEHWLKNRTMSLSQLMQILDHVFDEVT